MVLAAAAALVAGATSHQALAQAVQGNVYVFHSQPTGGCPTLDWHVVVGPNHSLSGMIAWDDMKAMARVTGTVDSDNKFTMTAQEVGGQARSATVSGMVRKDGWLVANVKGPNVDCQGITVPWLSSATAAGHGN